MADMRQLLQRCRSILELMPQSRSPHHQEPRATIEAITQALATLFDPVADIEAFHSKFGLRYDGKPRVLTGELASFRIKFLKEEVEEYEKEAVDAQLELSSHSPRPAKVAEHLANKLDALVDEVYVALGTAHLHGFDFREAWRRVHEANMKKERAATAADSKRGSAFDVVKPDGWQAPDHSDLVADHAHKDKP